MQAAGPDPWPGGCECGGGATIYRKIHQYGIITPAS
jgi:hypothetical protein